MAPPALFQGAPPGPQGKSEKEFRSLIFQQGMGIAVFERNHE
jgi:hypothetical protein